MPDLKTFSFSRRLPGAVAVLTAAVLVLSGCGKNNAEPAPSSSAPSADSSATPGTASTPMPTVDNLNEITVSGESGKLPEVKGPFPFVINQTQSKVLQAGSGAPVESPSDVLELTYVGVNARTGKVFDSSFSRDKPAVLGLSQVVPGFQKGLIGKKIGDRVLIAMTGADGYDSSGGSQQAGIQKGDTLIFVVEILNKAFEQPAGETVAPPQGLPTVAFTDGKPNVTIPSGAPVPTDLVVQPLVKGQGRAIVATDVVSVRYAMFNWADGKQLYSTYGGEIQTAPLANLIPGWRDGFVGQTTGSRLMLIIPPAKAYPDGNENPPVEKGATLVFIVDLAFAQPA